MLSPIAFEQQQKLKLQGVYKSRGYSSQSAGKGLVAGVLRSNPSVNFDVFLAQDSAIMISVSNNFWW